MVGLGGLELPTKRLSAATLSVVSVRGICGGPVAQISLPMPASRRFPAAVVALIEGKRKTYRQGPQAARGDNDDNFHTRAVRQHAGLLHET